MKLFGFLFMVLASYASFAQKNKKFYLFADPVSILFRNPTAGMEISIRHLFFDAVQLQASYMIQDKRVGGFLQRGFDSEKSALTSFESYPRNRLPFYVYNGPTFHLGILKYFYSKSIHQYISLSATGRMLQYDSLEVQYNNTPHVKRESLFEPSASYQHFRQQSEKLYAGGIACEYGIRKSKGNLIGNFFIRGQVYFASRSVKSYNEQYNYLVKGQMNSSTKDELTHNDQYNLVQFRPQIGCRIGLSNFD